MIQNAVARLVFNEPKRAHVTPLFISLHWLPVADGIKFKTLMLAYRTTTGSAPSYFHSLLRIYIPSRSLRSASERRLVVPSQRGSKSLSRTFSFTIPGWWNNLPTPISVTVHTRGRIQTDRTGQPTGTRSPPGLAWRLRLLLGMTRSQRPTQGPSATASISATRGQAARMASMATTRGAACPRRVSMDKTRHDMVL